MVEENRKLHKAVDLVVQLELWAEKVDRKVVVYQKMGIPGMKPAEMGEYNNIVEAECAIDGLLVTLRPVVVEGTLKDINKLLGNEG